MNTSLKDINFSAYQYQEAVAEQFQSICEPLFKLGIKYFDYFKLFNDGTYLQLINNLEFLKIYSSNIKDNGLFFTKIINNITKNNKHSIFVQNIKKFDKNDDPILHLLYDLNMWHPLYMFTKHQGYMECYGFMMTRNETDSPQFYLNNMPYLEHFIHYFNDRAQDLIDVTDKSKLAQFDQKFNFQKQSEENIDTQKIQEFLQETQLKNFLLKTKNGEVVRLSKRQTECLHYLSLGKSAKEIGRILSLSPKAVQFYIQNTKQKTGYNRAELIREYSKTYLLL